MDEETRRRRIEEARRERLIQQTVKPDGLAKMLGSAETAREIGVSGRTLRRNRKHPDYATLKPVKLPGGQYKYARDNIEEFKDERRLF